MKVTLKVRSSLPMKDFSCFGFSDFSNCLDTFLISLFSLWDIGAKTAFSFSHSLHFSYCQTHLSIWPELPTSACWQAVTATARQSNQCFFTLWTTTVPAYHTWCSLVELNMKIQSWGCEGMKLRLLLKTDCLQREMVRERLVKLYRKHGMRLDWGMESEDRELLKHVIEPESHTPWK